MRGWVFAMGHPFLFALRLADSASVPKRNDVMVGIADGNGMISRRFGHSAETMGCDHCKGPRRAGTSFHAVTA
jgi:hypothetical protein